jgi:hypothetical protein
MWSRHLRLRFKHAQEWFLQAEFDFDTYVCDYDTNEGGFYAQSVIFALIVILTCTNVITTLKTVRSTRTRVRLTGMSVVMTHTSMITTRTSVTYARTN